MRPELCGVPCVLRVIPAQASGVRGSRKLSLLEPGGYCRGCVDWHLALARSEGYALFGYPENSRPGEGSRISSASKKKMKHARRCEAVDECNHHDYPTHMIALGNKYQAHCTGCGRVGPMVNEGAW